MKKFLILAVSLLFISPAVIADDVDLPATGDLWDNWNSAGDDYRSNKNVTDEDFDKAIKQIEDKKNKRANKLKKKQIPKGEEFHQSNETEIINENSEKDTLPVLSIPVELKAGDGFLPVGHYQIKGEKDGDNVYINFYQSQYLMAKFPAVETNDDFDEETITFGKWFTEGDDKIKVIFGSMDFNAYTVIELYNP